MKTIIRIYLLLLIFSISLNGENLHLTLYFDINKTLIASDKVVGKSVEDVINELLAEKYVDYWDDSQEIQMTYDNYVEKVILSKWTNDEQFQDLKRYHIQHFINFLKLHNHPLYSKVLLDYERTQSVLAKAKSSVFPSFYSLLNYLDQQKISYSIILRSMGQEIFEVKNEINALHGLVFNHTGKFRKGCLILDGEKPIADHTAIYNRLRRMSHAAIHDHYEYWNAAGFSSESGKPFYVDRNDTETLSIFFDDNIRLKDTDTNIVAPLDPYSGKLISIEELVELGQAVRVNTLDAILCDDYFINHVKIALNKHASRQVHAEAFAK